MMPYNVLTLNQDNLNDWSILRQLLWPHHSIDAHLVDGHKIICSEHLNAFILQDQSGQYIGLADASIRYDYVNGCQHSPVVYLEGLFILKDYRRLGLSSLLISKVEKWGKAYGCLELASDTAITNDVAQNMHKKLGFIETETVMFFKKDLD